MVDTPQPGGVSPNRAKVPGHGTSGVTDILDVEDEPDRVAVLLFESMNGFGGLLKRQTRGDGSGLVKKFLTDQSRELFDVQWQIPIVPEDLV